MLPSQSSLGKPAFLANLFSVKSLVDKVKNLFVRGAFLLGGCFFHGLFFSRLGYESIDFGGNGNRPRDLGNKR